MTNKESCRRWRSNRIMKDKSFKAKEALRMRLHRLQTKTKNENKHGQTKQMKKVAKHLMGRMKVDFNTLSPEKEMHNKDNSSSEDDEDDLLEEPEFIEADEDIHENTVFHAPFTMIVSGPSGVGKSFFMARLMDYRDQMISKHVDEIIWSYGVKTDVLDSLKDRWETKDGERSTKVKLMKGLPDISVLNKLDSSLHRVLCVDDLLMEMTGTGRGVISELYTRLSHHQNISVIMAVQNLFAQSKDMRNAFLNAQYKVIFSNPADQTALSTINSRMFPGSPRFLHDCMKSVTQAKKHGYLLLDTHAKSVPEARVRSDIFPNEDNIVFKE